MSLEGIKEIKLLKNGLEYINSMVDIIGCAQDFIMLHTYILKVDEVTGVVINALKKKADEGVKVFLIADHVGSVNLTEAEVKILEESKIFFKRFQPFFHYGHIGRRLHQKVLLVDNNSVILGGINLSKKFNLPEEENPWLDYACLLKGNKSREVLYKILPLYYKVFKDHRAYLRGLERRGEKRFDIKNPSQVKTLVNDWMRYKNEIFHSYIHGVKKSKSSITLMATYFIPGKKLLRELSKAKKRGVEINLIFCSISDHPLISKVERYFYGWYLQNGFNIYEWSESVMHGKIALIDDNWSSIGSYNHNYISRYGNLEINFEIHHRDFIKAIEQEFNAIIDKSKVITVSNYKAELSSHDKISNFFIYLLSNFITLISLILIFGRSKEKEIV